MSVTWIDNCPWCGGRHTTTYLCDPAAQMLQLHAAQRAAQGLDPFVVEMPESVPLPSTGTLRKGLGLNAQDVLLKRFTVDAASTEVEGITDPVGTLLLSGTSLEGRTLPRWVYMGSAGELRGVADIMARMVDMAIRRCHPGEAKRR